MRAIHLVRTTGKTRPALILTRAHMLGVLTSVSVAPITSTMRGIATEVAVGVRNGLDHDSVISCDNVMTVPATDLGSLVGYLHPDQEVDLAGALIAAYSLNATVR